LLGQEKERASEVGWVLWSVGICLFMKLFLIICSKTPELLWSLLHGMMILTFLNVEG